MSHSGRIHHRYRVSIRKIQENMSYCITFTAHASAASPTISRTHCKHVPAGSPSRGEDVTVYVWHEPTELAHSFVFCSCVYFCLSGPFNCISINKFSRQRFVFWLCSSGLISALLVLSTIYLFMKVSPEKGYCKTAKQTNKQTNKPLSVDVQELFDFFPMRKTWYTSLYCFYFFFFILVVWSFF